MDGFFHGPNPISQSLTHAPALLSVVLVHVFQIAPLRILDIYAYIIAMGYIFLPRCQMYVCF
jgi:hypothetical protein